MLCQLEMYFSPSFFDTMVHLTVHLVREIKLCALVFLRWMYPFERYMKLLNGFVKNHNQPKECIIECYIYEEAVVFFSKYLTNVEVIKLPKSHYTKRKASNGTRELRMDIISKDLFYQAHRYVLNNSDEVQPYINEYIYYIRRINPVRLRKEKWIIDEHNKSFIN